MRCEDDRWMEPARDKAQCLALVPVSWLLTILEWVSSGSHWGSTGWLIYIARLPYVLLRDVFCVHNWYLSLKGIELRIGIFNKAFQLYRSCSLDKNRDSSVGITTRLRTGRSGFYGSIPGGGWEFSLHHRVQNGSGAHSSSCPLSAKVSFPRNKAAEAWSWPLTSIECRGQRMRESIPPLPQYAFTALCSVKKRRDNCTFYLLCSLEWYDVDGNGRGLFEGMFRHLP
jgi:hypothetical protein